jgi:curved DNA-binding protein CbpA
MSPDIPMDVARAFYGTLARLYHPDTTTDPTEKQHRHDHMVRINLAWEQVEKAIKARR